MKRNFFIKAALLIVVMNILAACTAIQPTERSTEPIRVEFTQWWGDYTLIVAQEKGFFEKYGVEVEPVYYDVSSDTYPDLASGQIDGALIAIGDVININRSSEMKVVAISDDGGADSIVANSEINEIQDLRGKTIGVLTGSQYELMIAEMLRSAGMSIDDITVIRVNPEDAILALKNNRVQAVYTWEPFLSQAILDGNKAIYPKEKTRLFPDMVVFRKSLVEQRPDDIQAFLQAWFEAVDYRLQNPQETRSIVANYLGIDIEEVQPDGNLKILTLDDNKASFDIENENSAYEIAKITSDYLISIGSVAQQVDPLELLDPAFSALKLTRELCMNNPSPQLMQQEERRKRNALMISLVTGIIFTIVSAILGPIAYNENGVSGLWGIAITAVVAIAAFVGAFQIHHDRVSLGIGILIGTIFLVSLALPIVAQGQGLALGVMILVIVAGISSATLTSKWGTRAIISAFIIAVFITLTDLYLPDFGLPTNPGYSNLVAFITSLIYAFFVLRRFNSYTLQAKIIIAFIIVTIIPLIALGFSNSISSARALQAQSTTQLITLANVVADTIDGFMAAQLDSVRTDAKQLSLIAYLRLSPQSRIGSQEGTNARLALLSLTRKDPVFIRSIAILNADGINVLDTFDEYKGRNESNFAYFIRPIQTDLPFASNVIFHDDDASIYFSSPVKTQNGDTIGILRVEYHATIIQSIIRSIDLGNTDTLISLVDTNTYLRVGYTGPNRDELLKSYKNLTDLELAALQAENRLPSGPKENAIDAPDDIAVAGLDNLQQQPLFSSYSESPGSESINTGVFLQTQPWVALIRQPTEVYLEPVEEQNKITILVSLGLIVLSVAAAFLASQILTSPLIALAKVAEKIAGGDLNARAQATTEDEIGALSSSFNRMTDELNQTFTNLEIRVAERTTDLEIARQQSEKRANELQSIGEIAKVITSEQKLESLLPLITRLVSERFGFYHTGIFLIDETNQYAVLHAANSEGGKNMLARGHRLEVGESGIVGHVAKFGASRIALDVGLDAVYFNNPDLPNTRSEMALPLKVHDRIVGILDVQSEKPGEFTDDDAKTLGILADQVAIALENARLFTQTQQALSEAQALYRQNLQEGWLTFSREESSIGYQQNIKGGAKLKTPIETDEIRQVMNRGNVLVFNAGETTHEPSIVVPIKLRGQIIGALNIKAPTADRRWTNDEVNLAEVISERLSLALENARLIQESQRQVIKEQTISEVTGKIGASINLKNVLQTAVEELGRAMPGSEVLIKFQNEESNGNGK